MTKSNHNINFYHHVNNVEQDVEIAMAQYSNTGDRRYLVEAYNLNKELEVVRHCHYNKAVK